MSELHTVRPGESLVTSSRKQVVTSKYRLDVVGRQMGFGILQDTPTILPTEVAADVSAGNRSGGTVTVVKGTQGALPAVFKPEDQAGRGAFLGKVRRQTREQQINELVRNEKLGPASLAASVQSLIDAGWAKADAVAWGRQEQEIALRAGVAMTEPWIAHAEKLLSS